MGKQFEQPYQASTYRIVENDENYNNKNPVYENIIAVFANNKRKITFCPSHRENNQRKAGVNS